MPRFVFFFIAWRIMPAGSSSTQSLLHTYVNGNEFTTDLATEDSRLVCVVLCSIKLTVVAHPLIYGVAGSAAL